VTPWWSLALLTLVTGITAGVLLHSLRRLRQEWQRLRHHWQALAAWRQRREGEGRPDPPLPPASQNGSSRSSGH
jgi:hypothetical protein